MGATDDNPGLAASERDRDRGWLPPFHVPRPHLTEAIITSRVPIVVVVAAAGYGKSVFLREFAFSTNHRTALAPPLPRRPSAADFWAAMESAVCSLGGGSVSDLVAARRAGEATDEQLVSVLLEELSERCVVPSAIAIDDYHLIEDAGVHEAVGHLAEQLPIGVRLLLASRTEPPLPIARWQMEGRVRVVRADRLVFERGEIDAVLRSVADMDVTTSVVDTVTLRTEGWPAAVQLAALTLASSRDEDDVITSLAGSHRTIEDYFCDEVLTPLRDSERAFLLETSVADTLTPSLCRAITGHEDAGRVLVDLERRGVFTTRLDEAGTRFAYHHLFAEALRHQLSSSDHRRYTESHRRAANYLLAAGEPLISLDHLLAAEEFEQAYELMLEHHNELVRSLPSDGLGRFVDRLPTEFHRRHQGRTVDLALLLATSARIHDADDLIKELQPAAISRTDEPRAYWLAAMVGAVLGDIDRLRIHWTMRDRVASPDPTIAGYWRELPIAFELADEYAAADHSWEHGLERGFGQSATAAIQLGAVAFRGAWSGRMQEARDAVTAARGPLDEDDFVHVGNSRLMHASAMIALEEQRFDAATALLDEAMSVARLIDAGSTFVVPIEATMIDALRRSGRPDLGQRRAELALATANRMKPLLRSIISERLLQCAIDQDDLPSADHAATDLIVGLPTRLGRARLHLARGHLSDARDELVAIDFEVLSERAPRRALDALLVLSLADPPGARWLAAANRIADRFLLHGARHAGPHDRELQAEILTAREGEVLDLLTTQLSNAEIGSELGISEHTVKSHVKAIYRKLGVSGRSEAVRVARRSGILPPRESISADRT